MSGISYLDVMPYEKVLTDEGNPIYQYGYNFYRSIEIDETEGLEFMGFNLNEERNNNMQKTNSLYVRLFTDADFKLWKGLDLGVKFQYERKNINSSSLTRQILIKCENWLIVILLVQLAILCIICPREVISRRIIRMKSILIFEHN